MCLAEFITLVRERLEEAGRDGEAPILVTSRPFFGDSRALPGTDARPLARRNSPARAPQNRQQHLGTCALGLAAGEGRVTETALERP
jgi:hypothetical protein